MLNGEIDKARELLPFIPKTELVISGPELRTRQTSEAFDPGYTIDEEFRDISFGRWAGRSLADIGDTEPESLRVWISDPESSPHGGESIAGLLHRVSNWMAGKISGEGHSLIVTHPAIVRAMIMAVMDSPPQAFWKVDVEFLSLTDFRSDGRRWAVRSFGRVLRT